jgi:DNA (cytosine-5)-methyltransferase 1
LEVTDPDYGIPQRRHRIIVVGVRRDVARRCWEGMPMLGRAGRPTTVRDVIGGFPALRSGLSRELDYAETWRAVVSEVAEFLGDLPETANGMPQAVEKILAALPERVATGSPCARESWTPARTYGPRCWCDSLPRSDREAASCGRRDCLGYRSILSG